MKNIILLLLICLSSLMSCQIYPLGTNPGDILDNAYIKDLNNELDKYVGLWKGTWNGKTLFIELKKVKYHYSGDSSFYMDKILGERKVVNTNGVIDFDRITSFDYQNPEIRGVFHSLRYTDKSTLSFYPKNMCSKDGDLEITDFKNIIDSNTGQTITQMTLKMFFPLGSYDVNCPHNAYVAQHGEFPVNFPKDIILTKQ